MSNQPHELFCIASSKFYSPVCGVFCGKKDSNSGTCAIDADFRQLVIDHMISNGGDSLTGYFPALVNSVADHFKLSRSCVAKLGNSACEPQLLILSGREEIIQSISSLKIWIYLKV